MTTETRKLKINGSNMQTNTLNAQHTLWQISLPGRHRMTNFINMIEGLDSDRRDFDFVAIAIFSLSGTHCQNVSFSHTSIIKVIPQKWKLY